MLGTIARVLLLAFWGLALANLISPLPTPWEVTLNAVAGTTLVLHLIELVVFNRLLAAQPSPWRHRLQVLLFGLVHLQKLH